MRRILLLLAVAALLLVRGAALGADPQPYAVTLTPTGNAALDQALRDASQLEALREKAPVGPFALVAARARDDAGRFQTALNSFGYYAVEGDPDGGRQAARPGDLPDLLQQAPADPPVAVVATFDPGPLFHLGRVTIEGDVPPAAREQLGLAPGAPAVAADVLAAQQRLLTAIRERRLSARQGGTAAGEPAPGRAPAGRDLRGRPRGRHADIGAIRITGLQTVNEDYRPPPAAAAFRRAVTARRSSGGTRGPDGHRRVLGGARRAGGAARSGRHDPDPDRRHGTAAALGRCRRGLFDRSRRQRSPSAGTTATCSATPSSSTSPPASSSAATRCTKPGYNVGVQFIKPDFLARDQSLEVRLVRSSRAWKPTTSGR